MKLNKTKKDVSMQTRKNPFVPALVCVAIAVMILAGCSTDTDDTDDPDDPLVKVPKTWTLGSGIDAAAAINKVAYGKGVFVATGTSGYAAWSNDGITWNATSNVTAFGTSNMHVYFGGDAFIATGGSSNNKNWAKSTDGKTWTAIGTDETNFNAKGGTYGNGKYLISGSQGRIAYSSDGTSWTTLANTATQFTGSGGGSFINAVAYGNGKYVAGGGGGQVVYATDPAGTWTNVDVATGPKAIFDGGFINGLAFGNDRFIAVGGQDSGTGKAAYSTDGATWTQAGDIKIGDATTINGIGYGSRVFVAVDKSGKASYSIDSGVTWTLIDDTKFSSDTTAINSVCYGNGKFVIAGGGKIAYSIPE